MREAPCDGSRCVSWIKPDVMARAREFLTAAQAAAAGDNVAALRLREIEWHFRYAELAGPAFSLWLKALRSRRSSPNPELMREAIRLGKAAIAYRDEMLKKHPDERFRTAWRLSGYVKGRGGKLCWYKLLEELERRSK